MGMLAWYQNSSLAIDRDGLVYCAGSVGSRTAVWCMGTDFSEHWVRNDLPDFDHSNVRIALDRHAGRLLVWQAGKHSMLVLSAANGATTGKLGGKQHDNATTHELDLDDCDVLLADIDGTMLALVDNRLVRYAADGTGIPTWPPHAGLFGKKTEKLHPLYGAGHLLREVESVYVESVGNHPVVLDSYTKLCFDLDGFLYAERSETVARFDRNGKRLYRVKLDVIGVDSITADAAGFLYVRGWQRGDPNPRVIIRVSPDGKPETIAVDRLARGTIGREQHLVAAADGTLYLFGYNAAVRTLDRNGQLRAMTDRSREWEAEEDKAIAARA